MTKQTYTKKKEQLILISFSKQKKSRLESDTKELMMLIEGLKIPKNYLSKKVYFYKLNVLKGAI